MIPHQLMVEIAIDYSEHKVGDGPWLKSWKPEAMKNILYREVYDDSLTWYSAVVNDVCNNGDKFLGLEVFPTDTRVPSRFDRKVLGADHFSVYRVPESVLLGREAPDDIRTLLTKATPDLPEQVGMIVRQLDQIVGNYESHDRWQR